MLSRTRRSLTGVALPFLPHAFAGGRKVTRKNSPTTVMRQVANLGLLRARFTSFLVFFLLVREANDRWTETSAAAHLALVVGSLRETFDAFRICVYIYLALNIRIIENRGGSEARA